MDPSVAFALARLRNETDRELLRVEDAINTIYTLLMVITIMLMQAGFAMLEAGSVRERAVRDVLFKNLMDISVGALAWFILGYLIYSDSGNAFIGMPVVTVTETVTPFDIIQQAHATLHGPAVSQYLASFVFAATSATIVSGSIAERTQQRAYIISSTVIVAIIYPVVAHWLWASRGWLAYAGESAVSGGAFDFAGGGAVHMTGGMMALVAAKVVGPRARLGVDAAAAPPIRGLQKYPKNSAVLVCLGTLILWVGWLAFNCSSFSDITAPGAAELAAQTAVRTTLSGGAGLLAAVTAARCRGKVGPMGQWGVWSLDHACNGLLAGLVSITAGAPVVSEWAALIIGAVGGLVYYGASHLVADVLHIDDVVDAAAVHGACGVWSLLAVGLMADGSLPPRERGGPPLVVRGALADGGSGDLFAAEALAVLVISAWAIALSALLFVPTMRLGLLRIPEEWEVTGIDIAELGRPAYTRDETDQREPQRAVAIPPAVGASVDDVAVEGFAVATHVDAPRAARLGTLEARPVSATADGNADVELQGSSIPTEATAALASVPRGIAVYVDR